jgi:prolyl 4-hydroxylase
MGTFDAPRVSGTIAIMNISDLKHYIRVYDDNLEGPLCQKMIQSFHGLERFQKRNGRGIRRGLEQSAWAELNVSKLSDEAFAGMFRHFIDTALNRYNSDIGLTIAIPNSAKFADLILKRYRPGGQERFQLHFDAINHVANRYLVLLWYLNDVGEGGETRFPQLDYCVASKAGRLLMFPPYWMYQHEGLPPQSGDKYILSTYLLFEDPKPS